MPNVAAVLKQEISRLARKEARILTAKIRQELAQGRKEIANLKRVVKEQERQLSKLGVALRDRPVAIRVAAPLSGTAGPYTGKWRKDTVRSTRRKLGLTQSEFAQLIGVATPTISLWENGHTEPRRRQKQAVMAARKLSQAQAAKRLESS